MNEFNTYAIDKNVFDCLGKAISCRTIECRIHLSQLKIRRQDVDFFRKQRIDYSESEIGV